MRTFRRTATAKYSGLVATIAMLCLSSCGSSEKLELRVMTFNIEWGGTHISFENVVDVIRQSDADIVGIQEAEGNLSRLANELGWHFDAQTYAVSRYPIFDAPHSNHQYVFVEVRPDQVVALANVHLPSDPYGPYLVRDGGSVEDVIELEKSVRLEPLRPYLDVLQRVIIADMPVFLTGDFNAPSHRDWTSNMVGARPFLRYPVDWPVSRAVEAAGFKDSWRVAHPDPVAAPGLTWWADRPPLELYAPGDNDPHDRIDFVWFAGPAEVMSSELVGEKSVSPWPSDHRAVVSNFTVIPATMPRLVDIGKRIYSDADEITIAYRRAADSTIEIAGYSRKDVTGDGEMKIAAGELEAGHYVVNMHSTGAETISKEFWIVDGSASPTVEVRHDTYEVGEAIQIRWRDGPGNRNDYLAVYAEGDPSEYEGGLTWLYVNALPAGSVSLDESTSKALWPLPPGTYVARLIKDDGYETLAESKPFVVR